MSRHLLLDQIHLGCDENEDHHQETAAKEKPENSEAKKPLPDQSHLTSIGKMNYRHEHAVKEKAKRFVGRIHLRDKITQFCTSSNVENSTMIVTGEPGDGKTSLMAYASAKCIDNSRKQGDFVFVHVIDCCPGSNILQNMLKRLHLNLDEYTNENYPMETITDLKTLHVARLEEVANEYPNNKFIIFVDAVNQLFSSMNSHSMWWLPSRNAPNNLRVVLSTLSYTTYTFDNALKRCPNAVVVKMPREMSEEDCREMVTNLLKERNLTITTENNDPVIGNQMEKLLNKCKSPLYLKVAVEGLRTKWIMATRTPQIEQYTIYIENLSLTSEELFEKLLESWQGDFGFQLVRWVTMIITLSRDGLKESMLIDLLAAVKRCYKIKFEFSVKTVLDFIRGFLSTESMDYIRFFHDELLHHVVLHRYDRRGFAAEVHDMIVRFSLYYIKSKISGKNVKGYLHYEDCLSQVVYHQTEIRKAKDEDRTIRQVSTYKDTLRNIHFIKERIASNQENELLNDFRDTINIEMDERERATISEWEHFTQFYMPYIKMFPHWSYSFVLNSPNNSYITKDTKQLTSTCPDTVNEQIPLIWVNKPDDVHQNGKTVRCVGELCWDCCASTTNKNLLAFGCDLKAFICNQTTGDIVHQVKVDGSALTVHFSPKGESLWVGNNDGRITVWDTFTGEKQHDELKLGGGEVIMIQHVNDSTVVCGLGGHKTLMRDETVGTITVIDTSTYSITQTWSTRIPCMSYCYLSCGQLVVSGHDEGIIFWNVNDGCAVNLYRVKSTGFIHPVQL